MGQFSSNQHHFEIHQCCYVKQLLIKAALYLYQYGLMGSCFIRCVVICHYYYSF